MQYAQINKQNQEDLLLMEMIALPLTFLVLVWVFGGLLAAALPMALGALAIVGSMSVLRLVTFTTDVSIFALNLSTALGVALAVDYTLLILSRYRDELAGGSDPNEALIRTMATSGRTVLFSAVTVALSMSATVAFPMYFLKSFAYAGVATVAFVAIASIVVTPAAIVLLGFPAGRAERPQAVPPIQGPDPAAQTGRGAVLVSVEQVRDAPLGAGRTRGHRVAAAARASVLLGEVGFPRRPGAAAFGVVASGR